MRKSKRGVQENAAPDATRGRVLARILAEDLRLVRGEDDSPFTLDATLTDPPPGYDVTFRGSDSSDNLF
jgi:hypothetical protein